MRRTRLRISRQLLGVWAGLSVIVLLGFLGLMVVFPWSVEVSHDGAVSGEDGLFSAEWPRSLLQEERDSLLKLRRFPRAEQERRLAIQFRRMEFLYATLLSFVSSSGVELLRGEFLAPDVRSATPLSHSSGGMEEVFYFPATGGFSLKKAIRLRAGDELLFSSSLTRERRHLSFYMLPVAPGAIRGFLGKKYSFTERFEVVDVERPKWVSQEIYDSTASQFRLQALAGEVLLIGGRVSRFEKSGRIPVQVEKNDRFFVASSDQRQIAHVREDEKLGDLSFPIDDLSNEAVEGSVRTVALGYNLLVIRLPGFLSFSAGQSGSFFEEWHRELLRVGSLSQDFEVSDVADWQFGGAGGLVSELSRRLESFGYRTAYFGAGQLRDDHLSAGNEVKWLGEADWQLYQAHLEADKRQKAPRGLDAIFDVKGEESDLEFGDRERSEFLRHARRSGRLSELHDFGGFEEFYFHAPGDDGLVSSVWNYQKWLQRHWQVRFFHYLDFADLEVGRPSLQDLGRALVHRSSAMMMPLRAKELAGEMRGWRAVNQILEAVRARRLSHRTVIAIVSEGNDAHLGQASMRLYVPGLEARSDTPAKLSDAVSFLTSLLGVRSAKSESRQSESESLRDHVYRFTILKQRESCGKVRWVSAHPMRELRWSGVKLEGRPELGVVDFYPCSVEGTGQIVWNSDKQARFSAESPRQMLWGGELLKETTDATNIRLLYTESLLSESEELLLEHPYLAARAKVVQKKLLEDPVSRLQEYVRITDDRSRALILLEASRKPQDGMPALVRPQF